MTRRAPAGGADVTPTFAPADGHRIDRSRAGREDILDRGTAHTQKR
jgi:hypothetical protein